MTSLVIVSDMMVLACRLNLERVLKGRNGLIWCVAVLRVLIACTMGIKRSLVRYEEGWYSVVYEQVDER